MPERRDSGNRCRHVDHWREREGADGPFRPDFRAVIETDDGAVIMVEWHGYGRAYPLDRRQIVGAVFTWPTGSPTAGSTTRSAFVSARSAPPATRARPGPIWSWTSPS